MMKIKSYILLMTALLLTSIGSVSFAEDPPYGPCPQNNPDCNSQTTTTTNSQSNGGSYVPFTSEADKKATCATDTASNTPYCQNAYSCETLFPDHKTAIKCNWNRCMVEKWYPTSDTDTDNPCNCKYGVGGNWEKVGIPLNTSIPFVGRCVSKSSGEAGDSSSLNAFPTIISAATRILVTVILLVSFVMIVVWGVEWSSGDAKAWKAKITKVAIGIAMLGMMGAILRLINPNFFK